MTPNRIIITYVRKVKKMQDLKTKCKYHADIYTMRYTYINCNFPNAVSSKCNYFRMFDIYVDTTTTIIEIRNFMFIIVPHWTCWIWINDTYKTTFIKKNWSKEVIGKATGPRRHVDGEMGWQKDSHCKSSINLRLSRAGDFFSVNI